MSDGTRRGSVRPSRGGLRARGSRAAGRAEAALARAWTAGSGGGQLARTLSGFSAFSARTWRNRGSPRGRGAGKPVHKCLAVVPRKASWRRCPGGGGEGAAGAEPRAPSSRGPSAGRGGTGTGPLSAAPPRARRPGIWTLLRCQHRLAGALGRPLPSSADFLSLRRGAGSSLCCWARTGGGPGGCGPPGPRQPRRGVGPREAQAHPPWSPSYRRSGLDTGEPRPRPRARGARPRLLCPGDHGLPQTRPLCRQAGRRVPCECKRATQPCRLPSGRPGQRGETRPQRCLLQAVLPAAPTWRDHPQPLSAALSPRGPRLTSVRCAASLAVRGQTVAR